MASEVEICNLALGRVGVSQTITSLSEPSAEAVACNRFYALTRDTVLRGFPWPFATTFVALGLVKEDPNTDWQYSYRYPSDCIRFRRIVPPGGRPSTAVSSDARLVADAIPSPDSIPYRIASDTTARLIYTDQDDAVAEYTRKVTDSEFYDAEFVSVLAWRLAAEIAPVLTQGDPYKMGSRAMSLYQYELGQVYVTVENEEQADPEPESGFIRGRD